MNIPKFPLIDLHIHLDGSLSPNSVIEMAKNDNISLPTYNEEELKTLLSAPLNCTDLNQYLQCFHIPTQVLQTKDNISFAVKSLIERLNEEGLVYAEIRFAPQKHLEKGLTQEEVIQSAINGMNTALNKYPIKAQLILCAMRGDNNYQENMETIRLAEKYLGKGVAACDLAGAESLFKTNTFEDLFKYAKSLKVPFTIHAGEADDVSSMESAIAFGAKRIGHGIKAYNHPEMKKLLVDNNIFLEMCPTSNINTKAIEGINSLEAYPIKNFLKDNVKITINTDNTTVSNTTLKSEYEQLFQLGVIDEEDIKTLVKNAIDASFMSQEEKEKFY